MSEQRGTINESNIVGTMEYSKKEGNVAVDKHLGTNTQGEPCVGVGTSVERKQGPDSRFVREDIVEDLISDTQIGPIKEDRA